MIIILINSRQRCGSEHNITITFLIVSLLVKTCYRHVKVCQMFFHLNILNWLQTVHFCFFILGKLCSFFTNVKQGYYKILLLNESDFPSGLSKFTKVCLSSFCFLWCFKAQRERERLMIPDRWALNNVWLMPSFFFSI